MPDVKVMVPLTVSITNDIRTGAHGFFGDGPISSNLGGIEYGSEGQIKTKLRKRAEEQIAEGLRLLREVREHVIGCNDGTVLIVRWKYDAWSYAIAGEGRRGTGSVQGGKNFDETVAAAKRHAEGSYGGVKWEC